MNPSSHQYPSIRQAIWLVIFSLLAILGISIVVLVVDLVSGSSLGQHPATSALANLAAIGIVLTWGLKRARTSFGKVFPFSPIRVSLLLPMSLTIIGLVIVINLIDALLISILPMPTWLSNVFGDLVSGQTSLWGSILALVVVAPLTEELLFRGLILHGFLSRYSFTTAILVSALLFGIAHLNPWQLPGAFILGVVFAWWFSRTRSLLPCLFGHALYNALPLVLLRTLGTTADPEAQSAPLWLFSVGLLLTGWGFWLTIRIFRKSSGTLQQN